jgi:hypothetical protein
MQIGAYCKTVGLAYVGSNPTPATSKAAAQTRSGGPGLVRRGSGLGQPLPMQDAPVLFLVRTGQDAVGAWGCWERSPRCCRAWLSGG